ncbi:MAG: threonine-phosphate decarboxylase CobD [Candidatus Omnitrophota bacterium]
MLPAHGGNIKEVIDKYKIREDRIIDFSNNINPLGISPGIKNILNRNLNSLTQYPDPQCRSARKALSGYWGIDKDNLLLGNGSNELIHLVPRSLACSRVLTYQPAFSEYEFSVKASGAKPYFLFSGKKEGFRIDLDKIISYLPKVDLIILCNPNNPTGHLLKKEGLLKLAKACEDNKVYLLIDEVFMDFVDKEKESSLLKESVKKDYLLILRSFTKFFSLPGLRVGYLVGGKKTIKRIASFQVSWSVNSLAQEIVAKGLKDRKFIEKTKRYLLKEKDFLFNNLKRINGLMPYYPSANFIFCKICSGKLDSGKLFLRLLKSGILIRDCSNFRGLDNKFFRVAVKRRGDNLYLIKHLRKAFQ